MVIDSIIVSNLIGAMALSAIQPMIPVNVRDNEDEVLISIKDTWVEFNPISENDDDNISVLNKIADEIEYSRVLGLNSTEIIIKNKNSNLQYESWKLWWK